MLKKYLLLSGLVAVLSACDSPTLNNGPVNSSIPTPPPPAPAYTPEWSFNNEEEKTDWTVEWNKPGSADALDSKIEVHPKEHALEIKPYWGGTSVAKLDSVTVYGTLPEPVDLEYGTVYMSLYYPREHLGNPWGTGPYWGPSAHHIGTQYLVIDSNGNRAKLDTGNGSDWINSFDVGTSKWQRTDAKARNVKADAFGASTKGLWFDLKIEVGAEAGKSYFEYSDNASAFDLKNVVGVGVVMNYALEIPGNANHNVEGASDKYIYLDDVAVVKLVGPPPVPEPIQPPPALEDLPEFGVPVFTDALESGFNSNWQGTAGEWDWTSDYAVKSGIYSIAVDYQTAGAVFQIGAPAGVFDLTSSKTFDFSAYGADGSGTTSLYVSMCDCDSGVVVTVEENKWTNVSIPIADFDKETLIGAISFKNISGGSKVYLDDIGFDKVPDIATPIFSLPVYLDATPEAGFSVFNGWGGTYTFNSVNKFETGSTAIEMAYNSDGWGVMQIGASNVDVSKQVAFHLSALLPAGTEASTTLLVQLCGGDVGCGNDDGVQVQLPAGEWKHFTIPLSSFTQFASADPAVNTAVTEIRVKNNTATGKTVYLDNLGFDANYSPEFTIPVYSDSIATGFTKYNGWGGDYEIASDAMVQTGMYGIEAAYVDGYGAFQLGVSSVDVSTATNFQFSVYVPSGTADSNLLVQLCSMDAGATVGCGDNDGVQALAKEGQWTNFSLPLADFPAIVDGLLTELRIKNYSGDSKTLYIDNIGFDLKPQVTLDIPVFLDSISEGFSKYNGWGGEYDLDQSDLLYHGYKTAQFAYDGGWGAMQFGASDVDISLMTTFNFVAKAADGVASTTLVVQLCGGDVGCGDNDGVQVTVTDTGWQRFSLDIADFPAIPNGALGEIRIKNSTDASKTVYVDNIGFRK